MRCDQLGDDQCTLARQIIVDLIGGQSKGEPLLPAVNSCSKDIQDMKRHNQYEYAMDELEKYMERYARQSAKHRSLLQTLQNCRSRTQFNGVLDTNETLVG